MVTSNLFKIYFFNKIKIKIEYCIPVFCILMGLSQNSLFILIAEFVNYTQFNIASWSIIISFGTFLFAFSAYFWGYQMDKMSSRNIINIALLGCLLSHGTLLMISWLKHDNKIDSTLFISGLLFSRLMYGMTLSALVPAIQRYMMLINEHVADSVNLNKVSIYLSAGRMMSPAVVVFLAMQHILLPWLLICLLSVVFLSMNNMKVAHEAISTASLTVNQTKDTSKYRYPWIYLALACTHTCGYAYLILNLTHLLELAHVAPDHITIHVGNLMTFTAITTLITQMMLVKIKPSNNLRMLLIAILMIASGYALLWVHQVYFLYGACIIIALGMSMLTPSYSHLALAVNDKAAKGKTLALMATCHTLGFALSGLLMYILTQVPT